MLGHPTVRRAKRVAKERAKQVTWGFGFSQKEAGRPARVGSTIRIIIVPDEDAGITVLSARMTRCTEPQPSFFEAYVALAPNYQMVKGLNIEKVPTSDCTICPCGGRSEVKP